MIDAAFYSNLDFIGIILFLSVTDNAGKPMQIGMVYKGCYFDSGGNIFRIHI